LNAIPSLSLACPSRLMCVIVGGLVVGALLSVAAAMIGMSGAEPWTIVFIHVPAAWLSLLLFGVAVAGAAATLQSGSVPAALLLEALAPVGAAASFAALWTGLASQEAQGAWWGWDARLVCELVLLLLFGGVMALQHWADEPAGAGRAGAVLVLTGALNIPIIYLSVDWWHTLHERAAASVGRSPLVTGAMALMTMAFCMTAGAVVLARLDASNRGREAGTRDFGTASAEGGSARTPAKEQQ